MPSYYYSSTAGSYTLTGAVTAAGTNLVLNSVSGLPTSTPFKVVLEPGQPAEEIVKVTAVAATTLTVVRGWDGTSATTHGAGVTVRHMLTAEDLTLSRAHEDATSAHGATGFVVGTTNAQTLSNKNLGNGTNTFPTSLLTQTASQTVTNKNFTDASNTFPPSLVTLTDVQTLSNKTVVAPTAGTIAFVVKGVNSQTANIQEWVGNSLGGGTQTVASLAPDGVLSVTNVVANGGASLSGVSSTVTSQGNAAVTQTTGTAKRMFIRDGINATTDASGYVTVAHGAPFTPRVVQSVINGNALSLAYPISTGDITSTNVRCRFGNWSAGGYLSNALLNSSLTLISWE